VEVSIYRPVDGRLGRVSGNCYGFAALVLWGGDDQETLVTVEFGDVAGGTRVTLVHRF
jgi:hypothetical protein